MDFLNFVKRTIFYKDGESSRVQLGLHWGLNILVLLAWCVWVGRLSLYWGQLPYGEALYESYLGNAALLALNIAPALVIALLFFLLTNRMWPAVLASGLIVMALAHISFFKLMIRDEPLLVSDIRYFFEAAKIASNYNVGITFDLARCYIVTALAAVFAFFFLKARFRRPIPRAACAVVYIAACLGLYFGVYANEQVYNATGNMDVELGNGKTLDERNITDRYVTRGFLYPLIHSLVGLSRIPEDYARSKAVSALETYSRAQDGEEAPDAGLPGTQKINFISVMLEAYCDFSIYDEVFEFKTDPYEFFHELQSESYHGTLITNIFSGGTINTERCFITGSLEMYDYGTDAWSYARYFNDLGYRTEFCHPGYEWYYKRKNVMKYLGFQRENFYEDRYWQPEGEAFMRDDEFLPDLAELLEEAEGTPYFNFSVTYQNHGPYAEDYLYDTEREYIARDGLSEGAYNILNNYFWGIKLTDESLRELVERLQDSEEPVVLVLFGDHKPWLGDTSFVYDELGLVLDLSTEQSFYDHYATPYVIWANDAAKAALGAEFSGEGETISPCFLMMKVFDLCSWDGPAYTRGLRRLFSTGVTVVNDSGLFMENGVLTDHLSGEPKDLLFQVLYMQYYLMRDWASQ